MARPSALQQRLNSTPHANGGGDETYPSKASVGEEATGLGVPRGAGALAAAIGGGGGVSVRGSGSGRA